jgi:hypothetical protein
MEEPLDFLKGIGDKKKAKLFRGIYQLFESRFPNEYYNIGIRINEGGFYMSYRDVNYNINFLSNDGLRFKMLAEIPSESKTNLEEKIRAHSKSNSVIEKTKYISGHSVQFDGENIVSSCYFKKFPEENKDINKLCNQLWNYVIKPVFLSLYD